MAPKDEPFMSGSFGQVSGCSIRQGRWGSLGYSPPRRSGELRCPIRRVSVAKLPSGSQLYPVVPFYTFFGGGFPY